MKCDLCNREENEFNEKFASIIKNFQKQIEKIDDDIKKLEEIYATGNEFTKDDSVSPKIRFYAQTLQITKKKEALLRTIEAIKAKKSLFYEVDVPFDSFQFQYNVGESVEKYYEKGEEIVKPQKMILCPYCSYLFKKSSEAAYQLKYAQMTEEDEGGDWPDDDDY